MKQIKSRLLLYVLLLCLSACQGTTTKNHALQQWHIDPEAANQQVHLSDVASTSLVSLSTPDSILVGEINHIYTTEKYIYVSDRSTLFRFSSEGTLVSHICRRGEGPDEYLNITDFQVTPEGDVWILCRNARTLYLYSWDNQLKRKLPVDGWVENIRLSGNYLWLYTGNEKSDDNHMQLHALDLQSEKVVSHMKAIHEHQAQYLFVKGTNAFCRGEHDTICHFYQLFNDTVYRLTPHTATPEYVCDWNGKNIPASFYEKNYENILDFFQQLRANKAYAYGIHSFTESATTFGITFYYQGKCYCSMVPKDPTKTPTTFHQFRITGPAGAYDMDLSEASVFSQDNGSWVISADLPADAPSSEQIAEDANPVLLIVKLP